jgi:O-antigen/teichoic acid export membrane protein
MMQNRFLRNVSANTFQLIINQLFGLLIFYALSKGLDKNIFGQVNWSLAVLLTAFAVLTFGIDQLLVRKIASGHDRQSIFAAYLFHVIISGSLFYGLLLLHYFLFPNLFPQQYFLLFIGIGKLFIYFSTPFKQVATGVEKFTALLYMSVVSNIIRGIGLLLLLILHNMSVSNVLIIFIAGDLAELLLCIIIAKPILQPPVKIRWDKKLQFDLLKESMPQAGVVMFTALMGRFDWILIGIIVSSTKLAEYSFAWKLFEVSTLPLFIIAPIMVPLFTRMIKQPGNSGPPSFFLEWQIIVASFIALMLNICWQPVVNLLTNGKYGTVNTKTIFILSLSMPLLYFNNYLWTINFARGSLKLIFSIIAVSFVINITGCCILIPLYQNEGAAMAYLLAILIQAVLYIQKTGFSMSNSRKWLLLIWPVAAFSCGYIARNYITGTISGIALPLIVYIIVVFISKQIRGRDWKILQSLYQ